MGVKELLTWRFAGWLAVTIILPAAISAYGPELRRLFDAAQREPRQFMSRQLKYKLALLERLHNSPYNLLPHFIRNVVWVSEFLLAYTLTFWVLKIRQEASR